MPSPERPRPAGDHPQAEHDPFWTDDVALFEGTFRFYRSRPQPVRARAHIAHERYRPGDVHEEIVPLQHTSGERAYVLLKPYVPERQVTVTVALYPTMQPDGAIGAVRSSRQTGLRPREIGHAQAWHYPMDQTLVLWECYLDPPFQTEPLLTDSNMRSLWLGTERFLHERFPETQQLVTPAYDPLFAAEEYAAFLRSLSYEPAAKAAFGKTIRNQ